MERTPGTSDTGKDLRSVSGQQIPVCPPNHKHLQHPNLGEASPAPFGNPGPLTMTVQSSEPLAMTWSLWGHQSMSSTGPVCPHTVG